MCDTEKRLIRIFGSSHIPPVNENNLHRYFIKLQELLTAGTIFTGKDTYGYFSWEEYYHLAKIYDGNYVSLKKEKASFNDKFKYVSLSHIDQWKYHIICNVKRLCDDKDFQIPLHELKTATKKNDITRLLDDFDHWRNCYQDNSNGIKIGNPCYLASTMISCWKCSHDMPVIAIVAKKIQGTDGEACVLSEVTKIDKNLLTHIQKMAPNFKLTYSSTAGSSYYANICPSCNTLSGDFFLHCEPGAPFFPTDEHEASALLLQKLPIDNFTIMNAGLNQGVGDLILDYAEYR